MKKQKWNFSKWFIAQFGKRPSGGYIGKVSDEALKQFIKNGKEAERILQARSDWDKKREAVMMAWFVDDDSKGKT